MNLRKDHCRNLPSRTTRGRVNNTTRGEGAARPRYLAVPCGRDASAPPSSDVDAVNTPSRVAEQRKPRRESRQGTPTERARRRSPFAVLARGRAVSIENLKRLSATDISALASMKNVAKCDTWCELQNPVNHRVFERKLRPKPLGRGHVCLGVTHRRSHPHRAPRGLPDAVWGGKWPPVRSVLAVGPKPSPSRPERRDDRW